VTGEEHVMALDINGKIYSWGSNKFGQVFYFFIKIIFNDKYIARVWIF